MTVFLPSRNLSLNGAGVDALRRNTGQRLELVASQFAESLKISKIVLGRRGSYHCNHGEPAFSASVDSALPHLRLFVVPCIFEALRPYTASALILCQQPFLIVSSEAD
jgi:hypothetical protein